MPQPSRSLVTSAVAAAATALLCWIMMLPGAWSLCPSVCLCRWKGGKDTTECISKNLGSVPPGIDVGTQVLDMRGNNLQVLPAEVFLRNGLLNLQKLYLTNSKLSHIDRHALNRLTNLVDLDLSNNLLSSIPSESLAGVPDLRRLVLNYNPIKKIQAKAFAAIPSLVVLEVSNCQVEVVEDEAFGGLIKLQNLKLNGNQLATLSGNVLKDIRFLHGIQLEENPWMCDCRSSDLHQWLLDSKKPYSIPPQCSHPDRIQGFDIDKLNADDFACAPVGESSSSSSSFQAIQVESGANVTLKCKVWADPEPFIYWMWQDNVIVNLSEIVVPTSDDVEGRTYLVEESVSDSGSGSGSAQDKVSVLALESVSVRDSGNYVCVAENRGGRFVLNFTLEVLTLPTRHQAPVVVNKGFLLGVIIGLGVFALLVCSMVCALLIRFCHSRRRRRRRRQKLPRSETQDTKGSSDSQNDPLNDKKDLQPVNPIQKPPRAFANSTYVSTSEISLHDYSQQHKDKVNSSSSVHNSEPVSHTGIYSIKPDIIKVDGSDTGEYSVPRGQLVNGDGILMASNGDMLAMASGPIYQNTGRWNNESPIAKCHSCGDHTGSCLGVPCLHGYAADGDAESERSYRANFRPTASGLAGEMADYDVDEWPRPPPPLYDNVKQPGAMWDPSHPSIPPRIPEESYDLAAYPSSMSSAVWERQLPMAGAMGSAAPLGVSLPSSSTGGSGYHHPADTSSSSNPSGAPNVHLKNSSMSGLSPFPILNLSTVRDSPDEGYEDEGEEGTEV